MGTFPGLATLIGAGIGALTGALSGFISATMSGGDIGVATFFSATMTSYILDYKVAKAFSDIPLSISTTIAKDVVMNSTITTSINLGQTMTEAIVEHCRGDFSKP